MDKTYAITLQRFIDNKIFEAEELNGEWYLGHRKLVKSSYRVIYSEREEAEAVSEWDKRMKEGNWIFRFFVLVVVLFLVLYFKPQ